MLNSPIFISMTRWGVQYGGPGGGWGPGRVTPTANAIEHALQNVVAPGMPMAGALPRLLPANNAGDDLDYILPATRLACNVPVPMFANPVGQAAGGAGANGQTQLAPLRCAFNAIWPALAHPAYGIIDSDAAHHMSLLLAERAFAAAPGGHARIVINFDAHTDWGGGVNAMSLRCDNWGIHTVRAVPGVYPAPLADAYVMIGNRAGGGLAPVPAWSNTSCRFRPAAVGAPVIPAGPQAVAGANIRAQMQALIVMVDNALNGGAAMPGYSVYLTVDRDFQQTSYTDYGDGPYTVAAGWQAVSDCVDELAHNVANVTFRGLDICGLPTWAGGSVVGGGGLGAAGEMALAITDICALRTIIDQI